MSSSNAMPGLESEFTPQQQQQHQHQQNQHQQNQHQQPSQEAPNQPRPWKDPEAKEEHRVEYMTGLDIDTYHASLKRKVMSVFEEHFHPLKIEKKLRPLATRFDAFLFMNTVCDGILKKKGEITFAFDDILKIVEDLAMYLRLNLLKEEDRTFYLTYLRKFTEKFLNRCLRFEENERLNDALRNGEGRSRRLFALAKLTQDDDDDSSSLSLGIGDLLRMLASSSSSS